MSALRVVAGLCGWLVLVVVAPLGAAGAGATVATSAVVADAAQRHDVAALRALVNRHANVNAPQPDGTTALLWAVHWNDADAVRLLLRAGANPTATNRFGASPLSEAA